MVTRSDPEKHKAQVRAANRARYKAVQEMIAEDPERFDALYAKYAALEGVEPKPRPRIDAEAITEDITSTQRRVVAKLTTG